MGRKKSFDRKEAVKTVMEEIWSNGYESSSVKSLSETLGLTRSSFYHAFGSREELFLEVLQTYFEQSPDKALDSIDNQTGEVLLALCEMFKAACIARSGDAEHRGCLAVNSIAELVGVDDKIGPILSGAVSSSIGRFEKILLLAVDNGELPKENIATKAVALKNVLVGLNLICKVIHDGDMLWESTRMQLEGLGIYKPSFQL